MKKRVLVWFQNNLRLHDNDVLFKACLKAEWVVPVYIFDPRHFQVTPLGFPRTGALRARFMLESVANLQQRLRERHADLLTFVGHPEHIIPALASSIGATGVMAAAEATAEEQAIQQKIETALTSRGISFHTYWQHTLFHLEDLPWPVRHLPLVFTDFRKTLESESHVRAVLPEPDSIPYAPIVAGEPMPTLGTLGLNSEEPDPRQCFSFRGGEEAAQLRLQQYVWESDCIRTYKETRDGLMGADYSSKLSPWLSNGCLSARQVFHQVGAYEQQRVKNESTYWLVFELLWRDFFRFTAKKYGAAIFQLRGFRAAAATFTDDRNLFERWRTAETGIPFIDANMEELSLTGYMSNRGRQNVASYLAKEVRVNWTWGAQWFESQLLDYDPTSNWLNWAYLAGVGNDPRTDRHFNIESQAKKYDPEGRYVALWLNSRDISALQPL